jgi:hypothetical protein
MQQQQQQQQQNGDTLKASRLSSVFNGELIYAIVGRPRGRLAGLHLLIA